MCVIAQGYVAARRDRRLPGLGQSASLAAGDASPVWARVPLPSHQNSTPTTMNESTGIASVHRYVNRSAYVQPSGAKLLPNHESPRPGALSGTLAMATKTISTTVRTRYSGIRNGRATAGWLWRSFHSAGE